MVLFLPAKLESTDILLLLLWEILFHISGKRLEHFKIKGKILESGSRKRSPPLGYLNNGCKAGFGFCIAQEETVITRKENRIKPHDRSNDQFVFTCKGAI